MQMGNLQDSAFEMTLYQPLGRLVWDCLERSLPASKAWKARGNHQMHDAEPVHADDIGLICVSVNMELAWISDWYDRVESCLLHTSITNLESPILQAAACLRSVHRTARIDWEAVSHPCTSRLTPPDPMGLQTKYFGMELQTPAAEKAFAIEDHSGNAHPTRLVARWCRRQLAAEILTPEKVLILHAGQRQFIWKVSACRVWLQGNGAFSVNDPIEMQMGNLQDSAFEMTLYQPLGRLVWDCLERSLPASKAWKARGNHQMHDAEPVHADDIGLICVSVNMELAWISDWYETSLCRAQPAPFPTSRQRAIAPISSAATRGRRLLQKWTRVLRPLSSPRPSNFRLPDELTSPLGRTTCQVCLWYRICTAYWFCL